MSAPENTSDWTTVCCDESQDLILKFSTDNLSQCDQLRLNQHLASCSHCRPYFEHVQHLDTALVRRFESCSLQSSFKATLLQRLAPHPAPVSPEHIDRKRRELDAELRQRLGSQWRDIFRHRFMLIMDGIGYGAVAVLGALVILRLMAASISLPRVDQVDSSTWLIAGCTVAALAAGVGLLSQRRVIRRAGLRWF